MHHAKSINIGARIQIDNKTHHFRNNLNESERKLIAKSANARLADEIYSKSTTATSRHKSNRKSQSPLKNRRLKSDSRSLESSKNSIRSSSSSPVIKGLEDRTICLGELVRKNSNLLIEKKELEQRIAYYKEKVAFQSQIKLKQYEDQIVEQYERMRKKEKSVKQLQELSAKEIIKCANIKKQIEVKNQENEAAKIKIEKLKRQNKRIEKLIQAEHREFRKTGGESNDVKSLLRESQKRLIHETVHKEELSNQKANLLIEANSISQKISRIVNS